MSNLETSLFSTIFRLRQYMRLRWFPGNSVALCADNQDNFARHYFGQKAFLDEVGFSLRFVFPIRITDYKIDL